MITTFVAHKRFKTVYRLNRAQKLGEGRLKSCKLNLNGILFLNSFAFITKTKIYFFAILLYLRGMDMYCFSPKRHLANSSQQEKQ